MAESPTVAISISFRDRDGNKSQSRFYCAVAAPIAAIWNRADDIATRMQALSNAVLTQVELTWKYTIDLPAEAAIDSTNERKVLLLMVNAADEINGVVVPSPEPAIFETAGDYAGIRVDLVSAGALGWSDMLAAIALRTDDDRAVGTTLAAGGLAI